ncbi:MAG: hypothetical protein LUH20_09010 [Lachnospiraceae bacterium]|nr:hypothetical protein [Lachnospiraceae bacterium]
MRIFASGIWQQSFLRAGESTFESGAGRFTSYPILGFHFDASDVDLSTSVAQCKAVTDKIAAVILHGIKTDGDGNSYDTMTEMIQHNVAEAMENGGQEILDALTEQLTTFLAEQ